MAPTPPVQYYKCAVLINDVQIPALAGASMELPENFLIPPTIGNYWQFNYAPGFTNPVVEIPLAIRDAADETFASSFLDYFFVRSNDTAHNTTIIPGGISFWDGYDNFFLEGAKADSFTISCSKGELISFNARFCGTNITSIAAPSPVAWDRTPPLTFANVNFTGGLQDIVWNFGLSFSNNHGPDMSLNGSRYPAAQNATMMTVGFNTRVQAQDNANIPADGDATALEIVGNNISRLFNLPAIICNNRRSRRIDAPWVMRNFVWSCLGGTSQSIAPLFYT